MKPSPVFSPGKILFLLAMALMLSACGRNTKHQTNAKTLLTLDDVQTYFGFPFNDKFPTLFKSGDQIGPLWFSDAVYVSNTSGAHKIGIFFTLRQFSTPKEAKDQMEKERIKYEKTGHQSEQVPDLGDGGHFSGASLHFIKGDTSFVVVVDDYKNQEDIPKARGAAIDLAKVILGRTR